MLNANSLKEKDNSNLSPIAPVATFDDADSSFQNFNRLNQISLPKPRSAFPHNKVSLLNNQSKEKHREGDPRLSSNSKAKSINSSNHTEKEFISLLSQTQNRKKKKLDLAGKYGKVYDQQVKDNL